MRTSKAQLRQRQTCWPPFGKFLWLNLFLSCSAVLAAVSTGAQQAEVASSPARRAERTSLKTRQSIVDRTASDSSMTQKLKPAMKSGRTEAIFWPSEDYRHRFFDRTNLILFSGVGAARALDFASTHHFRAHGRSEGFLNNDIVDNRPLFITIEAAGAVASIGASYFFHRIGQHKLERWTSLVHISVGTAGAIRNYRADGFPPSVVQAWGKPQQ